MTEMVTANWPAFAIVAVIGLLVAWWLFGRGRGKTVERSHRPDVLDEGVGPAERNQALIDAPPAAIAASMVTPAAGSLAGVDVAVAAGIEPDAIIEVFEGDGDDADVGDDLSRIKGLGPKLVTLLGGLGVNRFEQIANWSEVDIDRIDGQLGVFAGRIRRDNWIEQARYLASGDIAGFEGKFGKI